mgnify:CR=1 FL=1
MDKGLSEAAHLFSEWSRLKFRDHDAILQTLDRASKGLYLNKEMFQPTLDAWAGIPLIWAQDHPEMDAYNADPKAELARIGGRLVGECAGAAIDAVGHPRLMGKLVVDDPEVEAGIKEGEVSLSTGFYARSNERELTGPVKPHHILLFREIGGTLPGDKGAFILNTTTKEMEEAMGLLDGLKAMFTKAFGRKDGKDNEEGKETMAEDGNEERFKALEDAVTAMQGEMKALAEAVGELKGASEGFLQREKDLKWTEVKAHVAPGLVHKDKEAEMRALWEKDPASFMLKALTYKEAPPEKAEGVMFTARDGSKVKPEEQFRKLRIPSIDIEGVQ